MSVEHYCDICGKKMVRRAKCEFYCKKCDNIIFDWSLQEYKSEKEHKNDFELAEFCRGGDLTED